jgi:ribosomal 50S subunit-recycling heat shock protein
MTDDALRVDVLLHRLRLTRSRSEAKAACEVGAVFVNGQPARASSGVAPGSTVRIRFPRRLLEFELLSLPGKSLAKQSARDHVRTLRDEVGHDDDE